MRFVSAPWSLLFITTCATAQTIDDTPIVVPSIKPAHGTHH